jgi:hypothetical protein
MHSAETVSLVLDLVGRGLNDCEIARMTGVPRSTVRDWRVGKVPMRAGGRCEICAGKSLDTPGAAYAYLLGMYLGGRMHLAPSAGLPTTDHSRP